MRNIVHWFVHRLSHSSPAKYNISKVTEHYLKDQKYLAACFAKCPLTAVQMSYPDRYPVCD